MNTSGRTIWRPWSIPAVARVRAGADHQPSAPEGGDRQVPGPEAAVSRRREARRPPAGRRQPERHVGRTAGESHERGAAAGAVDSGSVTTRSGRSMPAGRWRPSRTSPSGSAMSRVGARRCSSSAKASTTTSISPSTSGARVRRSSPTRGKRRRPRSGPTSTCTASILAA